MSGIYILSNRAMIGSWRSWDAFFVDIEKYIEETFQPLVRRSSVSPQVEQRNRNKRINGAHTPEALAKTMLHYPPGLTIWRLAYRCTHGIAKRSKKKEASTSVRPNQHYRFLGCPAVINVNVVPFKASGGRWSYTVVLGKQVLCTLLISVLISVLIHFVWHFRSPHTRTMSLHRFFRCTRPIVVFPIQLF